MASGLQSLEPWLQPAAESLVAVAAENGLSPRVTSARRSYAQQERLYRRFLAGQSRFPAAPPGHSMHELGLAFDLHLNNEAAFPELGQVWEDAGGVWGGRFGDFIHFEAGGPNGQVVTATPARDLENAPEGLLAHAVDVAGGMAPGIGLIKGVGSVGKVFSPTSELFDFLSKPSRMIAEQPQFTILRRFFGF